MNKNKPEQATSLMSETSLRQQLLWLLRSLERVFPPPPGQHHAIHFSQYGSDREGWEDRLALTIRLPAGGNERAVFFLDDEDLQRPVNEVVDEIEAEFRRNERADWRDQDETKNVL